MDRKLDLLFSTPVAVIDTDREDLCDKYSALIKSSMIDSERAYLKKFGFYTTNDTLHLDPRFKELVDLIDTEAKKFHEEILGLDHSHLTMQNMWSNTYLDKTRHHIHQHPNAMWSGVFYLDIPEESYAGDLFFHDPRPAASMQVANYKKDTQLNYRTWWVVPKKAKLIFFPSWLPHGTEAPSLKENEIRMSLSWNYVLTTCSTHTMGLNFKNDA